MMCRVGVDVGRLARHGTVYNRRARLHYAGQMSRELSSAPVRIAELAISGASADASGRSSPTPCLDLPGGRPTRLTRGKSERCTNGTTKATDDDPAAQTSLTDSDSPAHRWGSASAASASAWAALCRVGQCPFFWAEQVGATSRWEVIRGQETRKRRGGSETTTTCIVAVSAKLTNCQSVDLPGRDAEVDEANGERRGG